MSEEMFPLGAFPKTVTEEQLRAIRMVVMDVDGVLTSGEITYTASGEEIKSFNVKDGHGIALWNHYGFKTAIITARQSSVVEKRAAELKIPYVYQGARNKLETLTALSALTGLPFAAMAYMGDDWPDLACLKTVGLATCPSDAVPEVQAVCHWVTSKRGGAGAAREVFDALMSVQGLPIK